MSLYFPQARPVHTGEYLTSPGTVILAEGQALVRAKQLQSEGVTLSTGTANDVFAGFAIASTVGAAFEEPFFNMVQDLIVPSTGTIKLNRTPVAGQILVVDAAGVKVDIDGTTVKLEGDVLSGLTAGIKIRVTYKYALSVLDRVGLFGNAQPGGYVGNYVGQIGYVDKGNVFTSEFDASVDWSKAEAVKLAAGGQITDHTGTGVVIPNVQIVSVPGVQVPYLGLYLA